MAKVVHEIGWSLVQLLAQAQCEPQVVPDAMSRRWRAELACFATSSHSCMLLVQANLLMLSPGVM